MQQYDGIAIECDPSDIFFQEVPILSRQYPSVRLWYGVLEDALEELGVLVRTPQRIMSYRKWKATVAWVRETAEDDWPGSFNRIITILGTSPTKVRAALEGFRCKCCNNLVMHEPCNRVVKRRKKHARKKR